jgi:hypothetical protein
MRNIGNVSAEKNLRASLGVSESYGFRTNQSHNPEGVWKSRDE